MACTLERRFGKDKPAKPVESPCFEAHGQQSRTNYGRLSGAAYAERRNLAHLRGAVTAEIRGTEDAFLSLAEHGYRVRWPSLRGHA
jgi:hypothetical protein